MQLKDIFPTRVKKIYTHEAIKLANESWHPEELEPAMIKSESQYLQKRIHQLAESFP